MRQVSGAHPIEAMKAAGQNSLDMVSLYTLRDPERERTHIDAMFSNLMGEFSGPKQ
jgi:hypothetical protein